MMASLIMWIMIVIWYDNDIENENDNVDNVCWLICGGEWCGGKSRKIPLDPQILSGHTSTFLLA